MPPAERSAVYILYYTPEAICHALYERGRFLADNDPGTPKKVVVVAVVHHISWATARAGPSKRVGGLMGTVDIVVVVVVVVVVTVLRYISWAAVRAGPSKHVGRLMGRAERPRAHISWAAAPARPINFSEDGSRPDPAHQIFKSLGPARPGSAHHIFKNLGLARHNIQIGPARPGPDKRPMTSPENTSLCPFEEWLFSNFFE